MEIRTNKVPVESTSSSFQAADTELSIPPTIALWLRDSYCFKYEKARVLAVQTVGESIAIILSSSIFHPQGGGQPAGVSFAIVFPRA